MGHYGWPTDDWNKAKRQAMAILRDVARAEDTISYSELAAQISAVSFGPDEHGYHAFLGEISEAEDDAGRGLLTVIVVHKDGDMMPGTGWFELARSRGRNVADKIRAWTEEINAVYAVWKARG